MFFDIFDSLCDPMHFILYIKEHSEQGPIGYTRLPRQSGHRKGQKEPPAEALGQEVTGLESARRRVGKVRLDRSEGPDTEGP